MSNPQLNDPTINWYITAENIRTSTVGSNLTLDASANINLFSGTGPTGSIYFNNNAWFDSSANLNFSFGEGTYENALQTSTSSSTLILTNDDLFKTYSFNPTSTKIIRLPLSSTCKIGSWININNFSSISSITITDSTGTLVYIILSPCISGTIGGNGIKMLTVSSLAQTGGGFADNWLCSQSGGGPTGPTGPTGIQGESGVSSGLIFYMNYSQTTNPLISQLSGGTLPAGIIDTVPPPATNPVISPAPSNPTNVRLLSLTTSAALQTSIAAQINSQNQEEWLSQFAIYKSQLQNQSFIPEGIWDMNIFAKAPAVGDNAHISLKYHLYGITVNGVGTITSTTEIGAGSSSQFVTGQSSSVYTLSLLVPYTNISTYDALYVIVTATNNVATNHDTVIYFESSATYSHIHTSFGVYGFTGPTGVTGQTGPTGYTGPAQNLAQTLAIGNNAGPTGINMNQQPITNVPTISNTGSITIAPGIGATGNLNLMDGATGSVIISTSNTGPTGAVVVTNNQLGYLGGPLLQLVNTNSVAGPTSGIPSIESYKSGRNILQNEYIYSQSAYGKSYTGAKTEYSRITTQVTNSSVGGGDDGALGIWCSVNGVMQQVMLFNGADNENNSFRPLDMNGNALKSSTGPALFLDASTNSVPLIMQTANTGPTGSGSGLQLTGKSVLGATGTAGTTGLTGIAPFIYSGNFLSITINGVAYKMPLFT
jgi:hypothetical protein